MRHAAVCIQCSGVFGERSTGGHVLQQLLHVVLLRELLPVRAAVRQVRAQQQAEARRELRQVHLAAQMPEQPHADQAHVAQRAPQQKVRQRAVVERLVLEHLRQLQQKLGEVLVLPSIRTEQHTTRQ